MQRFVGKIIKNEGQNRRLKVPNKFYIEKTCEQNLDVYGKQRNIVRNQIKFYSSRLMKTKNRI